MRLSRTPTRQRREATQRSSPTPHCIDRYASRQIAASHLRRDAAHYAIKAWISPSQFGHNRHDSPKIMSSPLRTRPLPGTGRLGIVTAYFAVTGVASAAVTVGIGAAAVARSLGWRITPPNPVVAFLGGVLLTVGLIRTSYLLQRRRKEGAELAALCLVGSVAASFGARGVEWLALGIPLLGLGLLASVWRYLEY